ncbi:hypothetical protein PAHAL_5G464500 [Panicum hallii]|nr:hypothetical protein PAHAL_5G464500 [Panicum hallii]
MARWRQRVNDGYVAPYVQSLYGCLHPSGPRPRRRPRPIRPHLGVEVAWPYASAACGCLVGVGVPAAVPAPRESPHDASVAAVSLSGS